MEIVRSEFIHRKLAYLQEEIGISDQNMVLNYFYDPVADYIKEFIESRFQYTFYDKSENQNCRHMMIAVPIFILLIHRSRFSLCIQILVWLHWKHDFT